MMNNKELKIELLEQLMELMDESVGEQFKPKEDEMPEDDLKGLVKEKMLGADESEIEDDESESIVEDETLIDEDIEGDEDDLYSDETGMSAFEKKLNAMKRKK